MPKLFAFFEKVVTVPLDVGKAVLFLDHDFRKTLDAVSDSQIRDMHKTDDSKGGKTMSGPFVFLKGWSRDWCTS